LKLKAQSKSHWVIESLGHWKKAQSIELKAESSKDKALSSRPKAEGSKQKA
jgi:hypothetical protein